MRYDHEFYSFSQWEHELADQEYNGDYWLVDNLVNGCFD